MRLIVQVHVQRQEVRNHSKMVADSTCALRCIVHLPPEYTQTTSLHDLHLAIRANRLDLVRHVLRFMKLNVDSSLLRATALGLAVRRGSADIVRQLLDEGCDVNKLSADDAGRLETPLFTAARMRRADIAAMLLERGADPNIQDLDSRTPLFAATLERNLEISTMLVQHGANLNLAERGGQTPLHYACKFPSGRVAIAKLLIDHGANLHLNDFKGRTCLDLAEMSGNTQLMSYLLCEKAPMGRGLSSRVEQVCRIGRFVNEEDAAHNVDLDRPTIAQIVISQRQMPKLQFLAGRAVRGRLRHLEASTRSGRSIHPAIDALSMLPEKLRRELKSDSSRAPWAFPMGHQNDMFHFPEDLPAMAVS